MWCAGHVERVFLSDVGLLRSAILRCVRSSVSKWVTRELSGGQNLNLGKLRLVVCTVWCRYVSTDLGEMVSVGKRWAVHVDRRALCPLVCRSSGGHVLSADGRRCSFELPTHPCFVA
jgi:hypothetical protein